MPETRGEPAPIQIREAPMADTTYRTAGFDAFAATRVRCAAPGAGHATDAGSWLISPSARTTSAVGATAITATKPGTQMFLGASNHRRRRLSEPSP
ncbi:MAG: hypothetical protein ACR2LQ_01425 [Acidimicrobiales bacterium]